MRFKVANYSRLEIRLDTLHIHKQMMRLKAGKVIIITSVSKAKADKITDEGTESNIVLNRVACLISSCKQIRREMKRFKMTVRLKEGEVS